ncbi:hypothetical protein H1P_470011 [Hyella patelloides LEGE 07179]|uniref:DUF3747 domain-containing protein n=1 Tax=Hyella patelloides LEGE 07179 TaxID=945734 RepID=A0A563VYR7_9CYAN|nr:DUF3747 domain-containing protein [Hyella patelloides]VEP16598.1 hypothetical protein H1P_470011 [Hyella patelloides LEGE 07179]
MKLSLPVKIATLLTISLGAFSTTIKPSHSYNFAEQKVDQGNFVAVAVPYNYKQYRLAIIEQIPGQRRCWTESGYSPTTVDLALLNFDHTNSCRKAVDTNGYTLRVNGNDDRVSYLLRLMPNNNNLLLVADHQDPSLPDLVIGRTSGIAAAPVKIDLEPGWQFTKRVYEGSVINHIYLSNNPNPQNIAVNSESQTTSGTPEITDNSVSEPIPQNDSSVADVPPTQPQTVAVANQLNSQPYCDPNPPQPTVTSVAVDTLTSILTPLTSLVFQSYNALFDQNITVSNNSNNGQNPCP